MGSTERTTKRRLALHLFIAIIVSACAAADASKAVLPLIVFEHHTHNTGDGGIVFSVAVFENGSVVFTGKNNTKVTGEARAAVSPEKAREWARLLVAGGALEVRERPTYAPPPDADWSRLTVSVDGRSNSYRFHNWNKSHRRIEVIDSMLKSLDVLNRWVNK